MLKKLLLLLIPVVLAILIIYWLFISPASSDEKSKAFLFKINSGDNLAKVSENLENAGLIRSNNAFEFLAKRRGLDRELRKGRYSLKPSMTLQEILNMITDPNRATTPVTIPEGFSIREIDERLSEMALITPGEFSYAASGLEGYLFPDTYTIYATDFAAESLIKKMQDNFLKKITPDLLEEIKKQNRTLAEVITMASIIEKEVKTEKDYSVVAGILWKRLSSDWPLQTDATLLYGKESTVLTTKELSEDSPYNTRKNKGLPPTPIGNPGIATIKAAITPEESPYWFYLTDKNGDVHYAKTNEEHNANREKYL